MSIAKTSPHDVPDPDRPVVPAGQDVTWSYTVTNTGTIELTSLLVSDDRGVTVTCPGGNPLPSLAPGASVVCTGTGPVTPDTAPAPKTATLTDDFSAQNTTSWIWGTGVGTTSGYLALGIDSSFPTLTSRIGYDLTSSSVCVHAEPASMMGDQTFLSLGGSGDVWTPGNDLQILQSENQLFFREIVGGVVSETAIPYDPDNETQHAWWRIREDAGIIYWQTSSDALTWTTHRTKTAAFAVDSVRIHLRAGNPVTAARFSYFDNFNLCPPPPPPPPAMTSLFDTFAGQDTTKWSGWGMTAMVSAGRLQVSNLSTYPALTSSSTYTMRGSSLCARVYAGTGTASNSNIMSVGGTLASHTAANTVQILYRQGLIVFRIRDGGGVASDLSMSYSASVHAWWRIREDGGTLYWETSSDGSTWVPRRTIATPAALPLDAVRVRLYAGNDGGMNGGYTYYDNVNSCPGM